jgi:transcriptional regulator with PAS, ATPase and Fis domain
MSSRAKEPMAMVGSSFERASPLPFQEAAPPCANERVDRLLCAFDVLHGAMELRELIGLAAQQMLALMDAAAAVVYVESPEAGGQVAFSGAIDGARVDALRGLLRDLVRAEAAAQVPPASSEILVSRFFAGSLRGAVLAERPRRTFEDTDERIQSAFARQLGATAATVALIDRLVQKERMQAAILEALPEGIACVVGGRLATLNRAAARLLGIDRESAIGRAVESMCPDLAHLVARGGQPDGEPLRRGARELRVTVRRIHDGHPLADAVIGLVESSPTERVSPPVARKNGLAAFADLVGQSAAIGAVRDAALIAARSCSNLVIEGESGVGKELVAQAIHTGGPRCRSAFVAVHCAAIPRELLESELFGYECGAFTGASPRGHAGKFELAEGGTLLLDDVTDMPLEMQAKLLRVLQERAVTRLGGSRARPVNVRVVATSNRPLRAEVESGRFRADLFYRLEVLHIVVPPLRDRPEDVAPLAEHFLRKYSAARGRRLRTLGAEALGALESYSWRGNVRELEHWIENEIHFTSPQATCLEHLTRRPPDISPQRLAPAVRRFREVERELYAAAIAASGGDVTRAARELGVSRGRLYRKLRLYQLLPR